MCALEFGAWQALYLRRVREEVRAELSWSWRLRRRCWAAWAALWRRAVLERDARAHEEQLRERDAAEALALVVWSRRLLTRCVRQWYAWRCQCHYSRRFCTH